MAAPKIRDICPKTCFLNKSNCIDLKRHKCIEVEYNSGYFGTRYMSVSIVVIEIQHIGTFAGVGEQGICNIDCC